MSGLRTQVKIEKDGFICPLRTHLRTNVRTRQDRKRWILFMSGHKSKSQNIKYGLFMSNRGSPQRTIYGLFMSGRKSKSQKMDLIYVRTQDGNYV